MVYNSLQSNKTIQLVKYEIVIDVLLARKREKKKNGKINREKNCFIYIYSIYNHINACICV